MGMSASDLGLWIGVSFFYVVAVATILFFSLAAVVDIRRTVIRRKQVAKRKERADVQT